jgi:hypothetical protein
MWPIRVRRWPSATLTVSADPTQVPDGTRASTVIEISGDNGQSLALPVSLLVGVEPIWAAEAEPADPTSEIFLPVVNR